MRSWEATVPTESVVNVGQVMPWPSEVPAALDVTICAALPMSLMTVPDTPAATVPGSAATRERPEWGVG